MSLFNELRRRHVFKVAAAYLVVAWLLIQIAGAIHDPMSLPDWFESVVLALLILGFPVALILAWAFDLKPATDAEADRVVGSTDKGRTRNLSNIALVVLAICAGTLSVWWFSGKDERLARSQGIATLDQYIASGEWEAAYRAAKELENVIRDDPELTARYAKFSWVTTLESDPAGATIFRKSYGNEADDWEFIGTAPLHDIRIPFGFSILRAELDGHDTALQVIGGHLHITEKLTTESWQSKTYDLAPEVMRLDPSGTLPSGMIRLPGWRQQIDGESVALNDFFLDRTEVTNSEYKEFVDSGGYARQEYWVHPIVAESGEIPWEQAISDFVDSTGRPGPGTWVAGDYPDGMGDHPVGGISWYEAAAYARFRGRQLPTVHHWRRAYAQGLFAAMLPRSNLSGDGTVPVGTTRGISWAGNFDMAGNVREWIFNEVGSRRFALGGAWNDESYRATNMQHAQFAVNRDPANGLRLALLRDEPDALAAARRSVSPRAPRDLIAEAQVSDDVYEAYRINFSYDPTPLNADVRVVGSNRLMQHELIEIDAAYPSPRLPIHLYLPTNASPPYQIVLYWPGGIALELANYEDFKFQFDFLLKSGRAVAFPVYYSAFGRVADAADNELTGTAALRDVVIRTVKDLRRALDYLETRPDIDAEKIAFFGNSWGAKYGIISMALDSRIRTGVLYTMSMIRNPSPDIDPATYFTRVRTPVLQVSGQYDPLIPLEDARILHDLLGTVDSDKRLVIAEGAHYAPYELLVGETLSWYDNYLGAPAR